MAKSIFVNLPVKDIKKSMEFFAALGWRHNPQFTDDTAASIVISDTIYAMVMTQAKFNEFVSKPVADTHKSAAALIAISVDTQDEMTQICEAALKAGGKEPKPPQDYGFMKQRSFEDVDGHNWEIVGMNPEGMPQ